MRLAALDITGFKSFAKHTHLEFRDGITGIVGPNGSGKSNIADAIRWVLGEQSMKTLRGKKSEDVVYAGGGSRSRVGMAEVSLTLVNEEDDAAMDMAEIVVTRRVYRSGESEYLLNNAPVRLLDVAEILAKAGFGQKTYAVIGQGMADAFVNASPAERRAMFEDATGVTPLLLKKEQTERRLEQTREHLVRAKDLLQELEPRLRSLKRQAARARSRADIETELARVETGFFSRTWRVYITAYEDAEQKRAAVEAHIQDTVQHIEKLRPAHGGLSDISRLPELRRGIEHLQQEEQDLVVALAHQGISPQNLLDRRAEERAAKTKERQRVGGLLQEAESSLANETHILASIRTTLRDVEQELFSVRAAGTSGLDTASLQKTIRDILHRQEVLTELLTTIDSLSDLGRIQEEAEAIHTLLQQLHTRLEDAGGQHSSTSLAKIREEFAAKTQEREETEQRVMSLTVTRATLTHQRQQLDEQITLLAEEEGRAPSGSASETDMVKRLEEIRTQKEGLLEEFAALEKTLLHAQSSRSESETALEALRTALHTAEQEKHTLELSLASTKTRMEDTERDIRLRRGDAFFADLTAQRMKTDPSLEEQSLEALEAETFGLRQKLADIGAIDTSVLAEETETAERVAHLQTQLEDLETASTHLRTGIRELDTLIHRQFSEGMHAMNETFNTYFRQIFGGGRAGLSLVKPKPIVHALPDMSDETGDTVLSEEEGEHTHELPSGVEIRANPPGKKLSSISQLSGGEKALTSIALLFAILSQRPSPFVVLDEVDAALDEANSRRFALALKGLSNMSQFLVITHNRSTMQSAGSLYGVTMSDDGASQLLSVHLAEVPEEYTQTEAT